jgi:hypothetical protein
MNMNCEDYREAISADPSESFDGGAVHVASCAACSEYRAEIRVLDDRIAAALAIRVPALTLPELPTIEDNANVVSLPVRKRGRFSAPSWIGIAAGLAIAAVLGFRFMADAPVYDSLADEVLAHLDHEPRSLQATGTPVSERTLNKVVRANIASMDDEIGLITYARTCVINGRKIPHLVIQGENGPVTLLLLPDEEIKSAISLDGEGVNGVILPVGAGSIAIIGERGENMQRIEQRVVDSVEWSI